MSSDAQIHDWRIVHDAAGHVHTIAGRVMSYRRGRWPDGTYIVLSRIEPGQGIGWKADVRTADGVFSLETPFLGGFGMR